MKKIKTRSVAYLCFLSMLIVAGFVACGNPFSSGSSSGGAAAAPAAPRLTITGNVGGAVAANSVGANSVGALGAPAINRAMLYPLLGAPTVVPVNADGSFTLPVNDLQPAGIVFVDADGDLRGHVNFGESDNAMPLHAIGDSVRTIDLGSLNGLSALGGDGGGPESFTANFLTSYTPGLSANERDALRAQGATFSGAIANAPADALLNDGFFNVMTVYQIEDRGQFTQVDDTTTTWIVETVEWDGGELSLTHFLSVIVRHPVLLDGLVVEITSEAQDYVMHEDEGDSYYNLDRSPIMSEGDFPENPQNAYQQRAFGFRNGGSVEKADDFPEPGEYTFVVAGEDLYRFTIPGSIEELVTT
ncbi:MAG: hypothetical protein EA428_00480, partial [Spirochaetaceae bacterium]